MDMKTATNKATETTNTVRVTCGSDWARFEVAPGAAWGTMHNSRGEKATLALVDLRGRVGLLVGAGWTVG